MSGGSAWRDLVAVSAQLGEVYLACAWLKDQGEPQ
jgi:hypothetical protein